MVIYDNFVIDRFDFIFIMNNMLRKSNSKSSLSRERETTKITKIDPVQICKQLQLTLAQASKLLSYEQFASLSFKLIKGFIKRAQTQSAHSQSLFLTTISSCIQKYGDNVQLTVRAILLEILCELNSNMMDDITSKLEKIKHTIIHTQLQYLLAKAFLLEERYFLAVGEESSAINSLKKCIQLNQTHLVQYLQQSEEIRQEIVDNVILAHYEHFKLRKAKKPQAALQSLSKACNSARKSYGADSSIVRSLQTLYNQQQHLMNNMDKYSSKSRALTQIVEFQNKKNYKTSAFYSWQDEKIIAQLIKTKDGQRQILNEVSYEIKLDIAKIKQLRNADWLTVDKGKLVINQDELLRLLGVNITQPTKQMTTRIQMRNLSRDLIIKKEELSSEDSQDIFQREEFNFLKQRKSKSRAHSSKKFKE